MKYQTNRKLFSAQDHQYLLDIMSVYDDMQNQKNLMVLTRENDQDYSKMDFWRQLRSLGSMTEISGKSQKTSFLTTFSKFFEWSRFFRKSGFVTVFPYGPLTLCQISERSYDRFSRKTRGRRTNAQWQIGKSVGPTSKVSGSKKFKNFQKGFSKYSRMPQKCQKMPKNDFFEK